MHRFSLASFTKLPSRTSLLLLFVFFISIPVAAGEGDDVQQVVEDPKRLIKLGDRMVKRGDFLGAEESYKKAITAEPDDTNSKLRLAYLYVRMRRLVSAYDISFPIAKADPKNARAYAILGAALVGDGRFNEARIVLVGALKADRSEAIAWAYLGMLEFYENNIDESLLNLREAVFYSPEEGDFLYALAQVSGRAEKYAEAAQAYEDFLAFSKNTDDERRARIKGLINFLKFLGVKSSLYQTAGSSSTEVPFRLVGNRPIIQLKVNGKERPLNFVLDTGSGISVISQETADALKIRPVTKGGFAKGIGGDGKFEIVYGFLRDVNIGDVYVRNVPVYIRKFHSDGIDGYIGLSLISKFLTTVDYGASTFALHKKDSAPVQPAKDEMSMPLRLTSSGFLSGEVQLEGIEAPLNFIVDTGASVSVISQDIAAHDSLLPHAQDEKMRVIGAAGITENVPSFMLPRITFGSHTRKSITAIALDLDMINEASGFQQAGILGGNFLKNYRMTFDFKNSRVTFVSINREQ
jgi:tetratricopeptide (TPR) repeat protein